MKNLINCLNEEKGFGILIFSLIVIIFLAILGGAFSFYSITTMKSAELTRTSTQAFYLAEAGIDYSIDQLRRFGDDSGSCPSPSSLSGIGSYSCIWAKRTGTEEFDIDSTGTVKNINRRVHAVVRRIDIYPSGFFDNALYGCADVDINGNAFSITGSVLHAGDLTTVAPGNISGGATQEPSISPLAQFSFERLRAISASQGNVYTAERLKTDDLPDFFWYEEGIPNVVYIESDLEIKGKESVGGFFVVVGEVLTDPAITEETELSGAVQIDGCIYTTGEFTVNGGGGPNRLNVSGGVWAGGNVTINGNVDLKHNQTYMDAIRGLDAHCDFPIVSWREM